MQDSKKQSTLSKIAAADKIKRAKLILPVKLKLRCWLLPVIFFVKMWCILRGKGPSDATVNWLAKYGVKQTIGKIRAEDGRNRKG